jgi:PAS domain-containing protein
MLTELHTRVERVVALPLAPEPAEGTLSGAAEGYGFGADALGAALDRLPVALLLVDLEGRVAYANEAARRLRVAALPALRRATARAILAARAVHDEAPHRPDADAGERWLAVDATPVLAPGSVPLALVAATDATDRVRAARWAPIMESLTNL